MPESIQERQDALRAKFASFTDADGKWEYLLGLARNHKGMDPALKAEKFIIQGCASTMYLVPNFNGEIIHFEMDVEGGTTNPLNTGCVAVSPPTFLFRNFHPAEDGIEVDTNLKDGRICRDVALNEKRNVKLQRKIHRKILCSREHSIMEQVPPTPLIMLSGYSEPGHGRSMTEELVILILRHRGNVIAATHPIRVPDLGAVVGFQIGNDLSGDRHDIGCGINIIFLHIELHFLSPYGEFYVTHFLITQNGQLGHGIMSYHLTALPCRSFQDLFYIETEYMSYG